MNGEVKERSGIRSDPAYWNVTTSLQNWAISAKPVGARSLLLKLTAGATSREAMPQKFAAQQLRKAVSQVVEN